MMYVVWGGKVGTYFIWKKQDKKHENDPLETTQSIKTFLNDGKYLRLWMDFDCSAEFSGY